MDITPLHKTNLYEQIADNLEQAIIRSKATVKKLPSEQELSRRFKVSRTVTREALKVLKERGLISPRNGEGSFITKPDRDTISSAINRLVRMDDIGDEDLYHMRVILESAGARLAAQNAKPEEIEHLESTIDRMASVDPLPTEERILLDSDFHITIARAGGNRLLWIFVEVMTGLLHGYMIKGLPHPYDLQKTLGEHKKIAGAIKKGEPAEAEAAIRDHLNASLRNIRIYQKEHEREEEGDAIIKG
jgi:GntR family transcriptional repressor for pyruvate dehydrogenase complex